MPAEIFMLKAEATARRARNGSAAAPLNSFRSPCRQHRQRRRPFQNRKGQAAKVRLDCIAAPAVARVGENCNSAEICERRLAAKGRASSASLTLSQAG